jgi:ABC-2 type transport system ATP-binding protein
MGRKVSTIEFRDLAKKYGKVTSVEKLTASISSGRITGLLGPNGAGKSTSLRCLLGLAKPSSGSASIRGVQYKDLVSPLSQIGAVLDSRGFHGGLTGKQNLKVMAAAGSIPDSRVAEVLRLVDLEHAANKKAKSYSLGMKQRLSLAGALLGNPDILILDEPGNGLDPIGIAWLRGFIRNLADQGKTILVSSHQLSEMQNTVDDVIILNKGMVVAQGSMKEVIGDGTLEEAFLKLTVGSSR